METGTTFIKDGREYKNESKRGWLKSEKEPAS
jgi:hypothetical protein